MEKRTMPWQEWNMPEEATSNAGSALEDIYELKEDPLTKEKSLEKTGTYDQQEYINSFADEADPVTLMQRVKMGTIAPWNGENCFDMSQMPKDMVEIHEKIKMNGREEMEKYAEYLRAKAELERINKLKEKLQKENEEQENTNEVSENE